MPKYWLLFPESVHNAPGSFHALHPSQAKQGFQRKRLFRLQRQGQQEDAALPPPPAPPDGPQAVDEELVLK
jgi:hypothetical protein